MHEPRLGRDETEEIRPTFARVQRLDFIQDTYAIHKYSDKGRYEDANESAGR